MRWNTLKAGTLLWLACACVFTAGPSGVIQAGVAPEKGVEHRSPGLEVSGEREAGHWEAGFDAVYETLLMNLHEPGSFFKTRYAFPSPIFRGVYLWDTAFTSQVWKIWDAETAREINWTVMARADQGRLQHFMSKWDQSEYTQPPVMAWSVWENHLWDPDRDYLAKAYPVLEQYNAWLYENRRLANGLFFWAHPYESGIDNSPRFGSASEITVRDMEGLAAVDLCSYVVMQNRVLAEMAEELGKTGPAAEFKKKADVLAGLVNSMMWDEESGYYYDLDVDTGKLVNVRTIASLFPLFAGIPGDYRAKILRDHVMNPAVFNTKIPLPTVARDDPEFERDMWRGPVWVNAAYMVIKGLERYGYKDEAAKLAFKLVDGVYTTRENTGKLVEFYDPDRFDIKKLHRKKGNLYKAFTLGTKPRPNFVGWTGLVNTMVVEQLIGFHKQRDERVIEPRMPDQASGAMVTLTIPADNLSIHMKVMDGGRTSGKIIADDKEIEFFLQRGERLSF